MPTDSRAPSPGIFRRLFNLARFVGVQVVVLVVLLEVLGRLADPFGVSYYPETARFFDTLVLEEPIGYRNRPGLEGEFWGAPVRLNSLGMRDREVGPKAQDEFRVLVLGDSVPFGVGVAYEESIPHRLEELLNDALGGSGYRFRTLNMGTLSYNTEQERIQLETRGLSLQPDAAFLIFTLNDIEPKMWVLDKRKSLIVNASQRSYAACLLTVIYRRTRQAMGGADNRVALGNYRTDHPRWKVIEDSLSAINDQCRRRGIPFVLFTRFGSKGHPAFGMLEEVGRSAGFPVMSVYPWQDARWADENPLEYQNSVVDGHPNTAGSRIFARLIFEGLQRAAALPQAVAEGNAAD